MSIPKMKPLVLTGLALWLSLAAVPTLSAASIFDILPPSSCINNAFLPYGAGSCPDGRSNAAYFQDSVPAVDDNPPEPALGEVFQDPSGADAYLPQIASLSIWITEPSFPSDDTLTLYFGDIGSDLNTSTFTISPISASVSEYQTGYDLADGITEVTQYQSLYNPDALTNIYEVTFSGLYFFLTPGDYYAWAVTATLPSGSCTPDAANNYCLDPNFSPLMSDSAVNATNDSPLANYAFSGGGSSLTLAGAGGLISGFNPVPAEDFTLNPEPSTISMLGIGLGLLSLTFRRRKK